MSLLNLLLLRLRKSIFRKTVSLIWIVIIVFKISLPRSFTDTIQPQNGYHQEGCDLGKTGYNKLATALYDTEKQIKSEDDNFEIYDEDED